MTAEIEPVGARRLVRCSSFEEELTHLQRVAFAFDLIHPRFVSSRQGLHRRKERRAFESLLSILLIHGLKGVPDQAAERLVAKHLCVTLFEGSKKVVAAVVRVIHLYLDDVRNLRVDKIILAPVAIIPVQQN